MAKDTKPCRPVSTFLAGDLPRQLQRALAWALDSRLFATIKTHGNTRWQAPELILLTVFWVWSDCSTLTNAFNHASLLCQSLLGKIVFSSYTGFCDALTTWTPTLIPLLWTQLHKHMEKIAGSYWRIGPWMVLAVDGSRTTTPRTPQKRTRLLPTQVLTWQTRPFACQMGPLVLRLMKFQVGRRKIFALTNVLNERQLTAAQAIRIYKERWGIEVQFRTLKQTFGRSKLYSRTPERAYQELEWSLIGLWLIELLTVSEQIPAGIAPERSSPSVAIQIVQDAMSRGRPQSLRQELRGTVKPATGRPKIVRACAKYRHKYRWLFGQRKSLTALPVGARKSEYGFLNSPAIGSSVWH
jgi:hypothetical protein